jgi:hypothetical protein
MRLLLDTKNAGREVSVREDDRFLVSYPKSGNTWMRFLLARLIAEDVGFESIERQVPDIYRHKETWLSKLASPRILKSHEYFDPRYPKVIYVVRDPRDVVLSYYHHQQKFRQEHGASDISDFVAAFLSGKLDRFGTWVQNVGSWLGACSENSDFLLLRYEDLKSDTLAQLTRAASHFGIEASPETIAESVRYCEFERMRQMEQRHGQQWKVLKETRQDLAFVRSGKVGAWRSILTETDARRIELSCDSIMRELGYA